MPTLKRFPPLLALIACLALVAGCGGDDGGDSSDRPAPAARTTPSQTTETPAPDAQEAIDDATDKAASGDTKGALEDVRAACIKEAKARLDGDVERTALRLCESTTLTDPAKALEGLDDDVRKQAEKALEKAKTDPAGAVADAKKLCQDQAAKLDGGAQATAKQICDSIPTPP